MARSGPLATLLSFPGIYHWGPPRLRPIPSLTSFDLCRYIPRDQEGRRQWSLAPSLPTRRCASAGVRLARRRPRIVSHGRSARAPILAAPVLWPLSGRHWSGSLRLPVSPLTTSRTQVAPAKLMLRRGRGGRLRARRRPRGERRDARGSRSLLRAGCCSGTVVSRLVSALCVASGGVPGGYRYLRLVARPTVCGAQVSSVVVARTVSRRAPRQWMCEGRVLP